MSFIDIGYQTCIVCKEPVEITSVLSSRNSDITELDSRPKGLARYQEKNYVHYCPNCGYASYNLEKDITSGNLDLLQSKEYLDIVNNQDLSVDAKKFYLVGIILEQLQEYQRSATSYLRAAWFFGDANDKTWMIKSRKKAIDVLLQSEFTWKNYQAYTILVDCYRRIEDFDSAIKAINSFGLDNIKDPFYKKLFLYELELCKNKDYIAHTTDTVNLVQN